MKVSDFDFNLPQNLIANAPASPRDSSRLLRLDRRSGKLEHRHFYELANLLCSGDVLVFNDTKVFPARLLGRDSQKRKIELLLLKEMDQHGRWHVIGKPGKRVCVGDVFSCGAIRGSITTILNDGTREVLSAAGGETMHKLIEKYGKTPLPPYIKRPFPLQKYQTVYAKYRGSVAAPTAGLHFTRRLLARLNRA